MNNKAYLNLVNRLTEISSISGGGTERSDAIQAYNQTSGVDREEFHRIYEAVFTGEITREVACDALADKRLHFIIWFVPDRAQTHKKRVP